MVRRVLECLPPGNKLCLVRVTKLLVLLRQNSKQNLISSKTLAHVFAKPLLSPPPNSPLPPNSSHTPLLFLKLILLSFSLLFKKVEERGGGGGSGGGEEREKKRREVEEKFEGKLEKNCRELAGELLQQTVKRGKEDGRGGKEEEEERRRRREEIRNSRRSARGWDDVFSLFEEEEEEEEGGEEGKFQVRGEVVEELGGLLFEGRMEEAKQKLSLFASENLKKEEQPKNEREGVQLKPHVTLHFSFIHQFLLNLFLAQKGKVGKDL